jgi:hypothetical protein
VRAKLLERRTVRHDDRVVTLRPVFRRLRVLAIDPGIPLRFEAGVSNEATLQVPWEELEPGPRGEYLSVEDVGHDGQAVNAPLDLDTADVLAQDGLEPSVGDPQFRQQMLYAVAMRTIRNFERALGRTLHWSQASGSGPYQRRLVLSPHHQPIANVWYEPPSKICFGYFVAPKGSPHAGETVFTCTSPDTIAHQLAHAALHGLGFDFEGSGPDAAAFQEGFADLVAVLQRFWPSEVLREQLAAVGGRLERSPTLGAVALQLGEAMQLAGGIRNALVAVQEDGTWRPLEPDPEAYTKATEPHERGSILLYAVMHAFRNLYEWRTADLRRIASKGTGLLPAGELPPDLVDRFVREAATVAEQLLDLCIRALDYLPPVEVTFGDFLRALVTAERDVNPGDERRLCAAGVDAFRRHGILPAGVETLSPEALEWPRPREEGAVAAVASFVRELSRKRTYWSLPRDREELWSLLRATGAELAAHLRATGAGPLGPVDLSKPFELQLLPVERTRAWGRFSIWWAVRVVQRGARPRGGARDRPAPATGCTLLVDAATGTVRTLVASAPAPAPSRAARRRAGGPAPASSRGRAPPAVRRLRVFSFDPSLGVQIETAGINEVVLRVPWERDGGGADVLRPGPVGEYLDVVDRDPASGCCYAPVDLGATSVLAENGLSPSESNPQFHQQMVYAVAMRTIRTFELALGRLALWSPHRVRDDAGEVIHDEYVQRLRVYPHALRDANAYYSPEKKALLFGYFPAPVADAAQGARATVFTCLSQDVIAHEVTHALLDGMHRRFTEPSNPDVLAFHEAFADLVALFQHFSMADVLRHQIASTRGDLASQSRLGELAQQFGQAIGNRRALRSAILDVDPEAYRTKHEPHDRGAILVAAVFDAFLTLYKSRVADLLRIASEGTGVLPAGQLAPDLVSRLSDEAARSARHVLEMCIRALDFCPPVDVTFGDYLRAIVTADFELDPVDPEHRRVAFVEAFRRRGIVPEEVRTLSVDGLLWRPTSGAPGEDEDLVLEVVRRWVTDLGSWDLARDRRMLHELMAQRRTQLHEFLRARAKDGARLPANIDPDSKFEVHSIRPSMRIDWEGTPRYQWIVELTQRIPVELPASEGGRGDGKPDFVFRGGCTLVVDAETGKVRYGIPKPLDEKRREAQRRYVTEEADRGLAATYFGGAGDVQVEPFEMLHR